MSPSEAELATTVGGADEDVREAEALDAYSRVVVDVAERLAPSVANLRIMRRARGGQVPAGAGSAVALTPDGFLLTSAHVVAGRDRRGRAAFVGALMRDGRVRRAYIGIAGGPRPLPPHARVRLGRSAGVEVVEVMAGSPAQRAGLRAEDLIVELGGHPIERVDDVQRLMSHQAIGHPLPVRVLRGDRW